MDAVWIDRVWRDTVWALLHNVRIRMSRDVTAPRVTVSGVSQNAQIHVDLPSFDRAEFSDSGVVPVRNASEDAWRAGTPVRLTGDAASDRSWYGGAVALDSAAPWGVLIADLDPGKVGNAVFSGCVSAPVSGSAGGFAHPAASGLVFGASGAEVLRRSGGIALLRIGPQRSATRSPFEVSVDDSGYLRVAAGWLNRNGEFLSVYRDDAIAPQTGILCLKSTIEDGAWTTPEIIFAEPAADAFPIARVTMVGDRPEIEQFPVTVATEHDAMTGSTAATENAAWNVLTYAASITLTRAGGENQTVVLSGDIAITSPTLSGGERLLLEIDCGDTARTVTVDSATVLSGVTGVHLVGWYNGGAGTRRFAPVEVV